MTSHPPAYTTAGFSAGGVPQAYVLEGTLKDLSFLVASDSGSEDADLASNRKLDSNSDQIVLTDNGPASTLRMTFANPITGTFNVRDDALAIINSSDAAGIANFDLSNLTASRDYALPDSDMTVFGRSGEFWVVDTFATGTSGDMKYLRLNSPDGVDRFLRFERLGNNGVCFVNGIAGTHAFYLFPSDNRLRINYRSTVSTTADDLGSPMMAFYRQATTSDPLLEIYHQSNGFAVSLFPNDITAARDIRFPDASGTLALEGEAASQITTYNNESAHLYHNSTQTYASASIVEIGMTHAQFDPGNNHNGGGATTGLYTCPLDGLYEIHAQLSWNANNTGRRDIIISTSGTFPTNIISVNNTVAYQNTVSTTIRTSALRVMSAGDPIKMQGRQDSGGGLGVEDGATNTFLQIIYRGPT